MFWKNKPTIKFHTSEERLGILPHPVPANHALPTWLKKLKAVAPGKDKIEGGTARRCMPVMDACSQGYIIPLWVDLSVKVSIVYSFKDADGKVVHQEATDDPDKLLGTTTSETEEKIAGHEPTDGLAVWVRFPKTGDYALEGVHTHDWEQLGNACDLKKFKLGKVLMRLNNPWTIETPPGWSAKFQNPANNWSNDIQLIEGVADTDKYYNEVNFPFVWTGSEVGEFIIPRGTPLVQVIPFKREKMNMEIGIVDEKKFKSVSKLLLTKHFDRYKEFFWSKK